MKIENIDGEFLSFDDLTDLNKMIIKQSELDDPIGYIDRTGDLLDNACNGIFAGFCGYSVYPTIIEKAVRLGYNIISTHVFLNANKRTGIISMVMTLDLNDIRIAYSQEEMSEVANMVADHRMSYEEFLEYIKSKIVGEPEEGVRLK